MLNSLQVILKKLFENHVSLKLSFDQRIRYNIILNEIKDLYNKRLLDVGCGGGALGKLIEGKGGNVTYLDIKLNNIKNIKGTKICGDGRYLPFKDKAFDYVVSSDVLEHLHEKDRKKFINEMIRVARKRVIFTFSQVHFKNPLKSGIYIYFNHFLNTLRFLIQIGIKNIIEWIFHCWKT